MRLAGVRVAHRPRQNVGEPPIYYVYVLFSLFVLVFVLVGLVINVRPSILCPTVLSMVVMWCERTEREYFLQFSPSCWVVFSLVSLGVVVAVQKVVGLGLLGRVSALRVSLSGSMWFGLVECMVRACLLVVRGGKIHFLVVVTSEVWMWLKLLCGDNDGGMIVVCVDVKLLAKLAPLLTNLQGGNLDMCLEYEIGVEVCGLCRSSPSLMLMKGVKNMEKKDGKEVQMEHSIQGFMVALEATTQKSYILKEDPQLKLLGRARSSIDESQRQVNLICEFLESQEAYIYLLPWVSFIHSHTLLRKFKFDSWLSSHHSPSQVFWIFAAVFLMVFRCSSVQVLKWNKKYVQVPKINRSATPVIMNILCSCLSLSHLVICYAVNVCIVLVVISVWLVFVLKYVVLPIGWPVAIVGGGLVRY